jgi:ketosteroid isomerase-like protein
LRADGGDPYAAARPGAGDVMTDGELRDLCNRFFDAIERHDLEEVGRIYAPDLAFWANVTGKEITRDENLEILAAGRTVHRRRTYDDRQIRTFAGGFLVQYSCNVVQHDGKRRSLSSCLVAECRDGLITRIDEYLDSSRFSDASRRPAPE